MSIRAAIVGPTGYTSLWLIRLLLKHPGVDITYLASRREEETNIAEEFPELLGRCEMVCRPIDPAAIADEADVAFLCVPHRTGMAVVPDLLDAGVRVVDYSADYRLKDVALYEDTYGVDHTDAGNIAHAAYGLPELFPDEIPTAKLVANPGCYPTCATLGIAPLLDKQLVKPTDMVVSAVTGVSGAGRSLSQGYHFPEMNEAFRPYAAGNHRHQPEMKQVLDQFTGQSSELLFVPHVAPLTAGMLATIYLQPADQVTEEDCYAAFEDAYAGKPFVRVRADLPDVKHVVNTNYCDVAVRIAAGKVMVFAAIDNMMKGASSQAVQNMNLMFDQEETAGLL